MNRSVLWYEKEIKTRGVSVRDSISSRPPFTYRFCPVIRGLRAHPYFCNLALAVKQPSVWRFHYSKHDQVTVISAFSKAVDLLSELCVFNYDPKWGMPRVP